jgi:hypothetical protein
VIDPHTVTIDGISTTCVCPLEKDHTDAEMDDL